MRRYEYVGGSSRKFWEIEDVDEQGKSWIVRVRFGRLGTSGQTNTKVFSYESGAIRYRNAKIAEKMAKGYVLKSAPKPTPQPTFQQTVPWSYTPPQAANRIACKHDTIKRNGSKYKCAGCGDTVEFDKPQVEVEQPEFQQRVRRFFAGASA